MDDWQRDLVAERNRFMRHLRRAAIIASAALLCVALVLVGLLMRRARQQNEVVRGSLGSPSDLSEEPGALFLDDDPSRLIDPIFLQMEPHGHRLDVDVLAVVIGTLRERPQADLEAMAGAITWAQFRDKRLRQSLRGRVIRVRGTLWRFQPVPPEEVDPASLGVTALYEGQIRDADNHTFSFFVLEPPAREPTRTDLAELTGVYYKLISYETRRGDEIVTPLIVGHTVQLREPPPGWEAAGTPGAGSIGAWGIAGAGAAALLVAGLVVWLALSHRGGPRYRAPSLRRGPDGGEPPAEA